MTVSGVHRGEQRKLYDERRRQVLPAHGILLVELDCSDLAHDRQKRLLRDTAHDRRALRAALEASGVRFTNTGQAVVRGQPLPSGPHRER
jgi:hypothetical protein